MHAPVKVDDAEQSLLLVLAGFAVSVIATRTFLKLAGYPQIASGDFHIAHVLWGGLLLFAAALLLLIWRGRGIAWLSSLLTGIGFGLFIDEVGKFITRTNDYFYPLAAPIIYAFFLLTVLVYTRVRRLRTDAAQAEVHRVLDLLERGIDPNASVQAVLEVKQGLNRIVTQSAHPNAARLAGSALSFMEAEHGPGRPTHPGITDRWRGRLRAAGERWLNQSRLRVVLTFGLLALAVRGLLAVVAAVLLIPQILDPARWQQLASVPWVDGELFGPTRLVLVTAVLILDGLIGILLLTAAGLMLSRQLRPALMLAYWGLLFSLTAVHLLMFYFNQFDVIATTLLQFGLLLGVVHYRSRYLD